jgi:hypothetical protein
MGGRNEHEQFAGDRQKLHRHFGYVQFTTVKDSRKTADCRPYMDESPSTGNYTALACNATNDDACDDDPGPAF